MGRHFGNLGARVNGLIYYSLSPMEQRAFAGYFKKSVPNFLRRIQSQILRVGPPFFIFYLVYDWAEKENVRQSRKVLTDFEHEK